MGCTLIDYFKCSPSEFNFRILAISGYWPLATSKKWLKHLHVAFSYLCMFSVTSMLFIQGLDLYLLRNEPVKIVKNLSATSVTIVSVTKFYMMLYDFENIQFLHKNLEAFKKSKTDSEDIEILRKADNEIKWTIKLFTGLGTPCVLLWMMYPGLDKKSERKVPFPYRLPVEDWSSPIYEILYLYQSMSMIGFMSLVIFTDLIMVSFMIRIAAKYDILMKEIRNLGKSVKSSSYSESKDPVINYLTETTKFQDFLKKFVKSHQLILDEINCLQKICSGPSLIFFSGVAVMLGVLAIDIVVISKGIQLQQVQKMLYIACGLLDAFFWCFYATFLQEKNIELMDAIYESSWHEMHPQTKNDFLMILTKCGVTPKLKIGNIFSLNLYTFLQILKITHNIMAVFLQSI